MQSSVLFQAFANVNGASFVGLDTETIPSLKGGKNNPMKGRIVKRMTGASLMVFQNKNANGYENMVRRRLEAEGKNPDFEVGPRAWGERVPNLPIVKHEKDGAVKYYLEVIFLKPGKVSFFLDGATIDRSEVIGLDERAQDDDGQGGLNNKVIIRTFAADSVTAIRVDGQVFA
jgi:hypothetical protein